MPKDLNVLPVLLCFLFFLLFCLYLLLPCLPLPVFSRSSPPPVSPPLPAVFAGSFSARHPKAAVAPASLPTSVFVVGDDMSKLWRAGEGRGGEKRGKGGRRHITRHGRKARDPERMSCGLIFSFSLWLSMWAGRNGDRKHPPPFPRLSSLHPLSSSLTPHDSPAPSPLPPFLFPIPPLAPPIHASSPHFFSAGLCCRIFPQCATATFFRSCLPHPASMPMHHTLLLTCVKVRMSGRKNYPEMAHYLRAESGGVSTVAPLQSVFITCNNW